MGYLPFNAGAAIHGAGPRAETRGADPERRQVFALLEAVEDRPRDHALIRLLYKGQKCPTLQNGKSLADLA
jgi:hypothetical protein